MLVAKEAGPGASYEHASLLCFGELDQFAQLQGVLANALHGLEQESL